LVAFPAWKTSGTGHRPSLKGETLLGLSKAKETINQKITQPINGALVLAATALLFAVVAIFLGVAAVTNAH